LQFKNFIFHWRKIKMMEKTVLNLRLADDDLSFVVKMVAQDSKNKERLKQFIREDPVFRKGLISDEKLFKQVVKSSPKILKISPLLFFEVLLRRTIEEMRKITHTVERTISQRIPVFDIKETLEFLEDEEVFYYLVHLLDSFVAVKKETVSDVDIDNLIKLGKETTEDYRFDIYKRIADICLFVLGIFPEYVMQDYDYLYHDLFFGKKPPIIGELRRNEGDYEVLGREFYRLAARQETAKETNLTEVLSSFSQNFNLAKKPLNFISEYYIKIAAV